VSVGHVQRAIEATGIPTVGVSVSAFAHIPAAMSLPRTLLTRHPLGRPIGAPRDGERQREITHAALTLFEVTEPTTVVFPKPYRASAS